MLLLSFDVQCLCFTRVAARRFLLATDSRGAGTDGLSVVVSLLPFEPLHQKVAPMMSRCRHSVVDEVAVSTTVDAIGCSYAENFLVTLKQ